MDEKTLNQETASFVERPWGNYFKLFQEPGVWVKRVQVKPGARLRFNPPGYAFSGTLLSVAPAGAASPFVEQLRKAEARSASAVHRTCRYDPSRPNSHAWEPVRAATMVRRPSSPNGESAPWT